MNMIARRTPHLAAFLAPHVTAEMARRLPKRRFDAIVIGAGVAGLAFALRLAPEKRIALLTKGVLGESNTRWAQGGLSAAIGPDDSPAIHEEDTLLAGAGLCDPPAVHELVEGAEDAVEWLLGVGTRFDRNPDSGELLLGREAAHAHRRVLHAGGDATGAEIERSLVAAVRRRPAANIFEGSFAVDLFIENGAIAGVVAEPHPNEPLTLFEAPLVVIAAGGAGRLWTTTSNPRGATADGLAMALRAGVTVADLEFTQFHPTVLTIPGADAFLISEAVRGEGAYLRGTGGERFMPALHPLAELAPRDVVARGIQRQMAIDGADHVNLDLRHLDAEAMHARFPTISELLRSRGLDLAKDLLPVAPAAHYFMGGIAAATDGRTDLPGLLALGEAACTGVHGANRLASNSLLEGLVFGIAAADAVNASDQPSLPSPLPVPGEESTKVAAARGPSGAGMTKSYEDCRGKRSFDDGLRPAQDDEREAAGAIAAEPPNHAPSNLNVESLRCQVQTAMSRDVAVVRDAQGLARAARDVDAVLDTLHIHPPSGRAGWEASNIALAARAIIAAAEIRKESRGAHYRTDFPELDHRLDGQHLSFDGVDWRFEPLEAARTRREADLPCP